MSARRSCLPWSSFRGWSRHCLRGLRRDPADHSGQRRVARSRLSRFGRGAPARNHRQVRPAAIPASMGKRRKTDWRRNEPFPPRPVIIVQNFGKQAAGHNVACDGGDAHAGQVLQQILASRNRPARQHAGDAVAHFGRRGAGIGDAQDAVWRRPAGISRGTRSVRAWSCRCRHWPRRGRRPGSDAAACRRGVRRHRRVEPGLACWPASRPHPPQAARRCFRRCAIHRRAPDGRNGK